MNRKITLQQKAVIIVGAVLFAVLAVNTAILTGITARKYRAAILSRTEAIGSGLQRELGRAVGLGIPVESIDGVNEKLGEIVKGDRAIESAMVVAANRKVVFHSMPAQAGRELTDEASMNALKATKVLVQDLGITYDLAFPLLSAEGKSLGSLRIGVRSQAINAEVFELLGWALGVAVLSFLGSLVLVAVSISRSITRPVLRMVDAAAQISAGDLTHAVEVRSRDEISVLGEAINRTANSLKDIVGKIRSIAESVSNVSTSMVASSADVLRAADVQKKAIEETAAAIAEMNTSTSNVASGAESLFRLAESTSSAITEVGASIGQVAENANVFHDSAQETAVSVEEMITTITEIAKSLENLSGSSETVASSISEVNAATREIEQRATESVGLAEKVMRDASEKGLSASTEALSGMENIRKSVHDLSEVINLLGKKSEQIGMILTVIDDITDQTNLLALNAAILAAQAGEHGKGFSVVADEIKSLAERTAASTQEIADLIRSVQNETVSSVSMASESIRTVDSGLRGVEHVNTALKDIVESSTRSTNMSKAIQRATGEQSQVIKQITDEVKAITEQVARISHAIQEQSKGSRFILEATEKVKDISTLVRTATNEQKEGSRQITRAIEDSTRQADLIAKATGSQKQRSAEIVQSMEKIRNATTKLIHAADEMGKGIRALQEETGTLAAELRKFKV